MISEILSPKIREKVVIIEVLTSIKFLELENDARPSTMYAINIGMKPNASAIILGTEYATTSIIKWIYGSYLRYYAIEVIAKNALSPLPQSKNSLQSKNLLSLFCSDFIS